MNEVDQWRMKFTEYETRIKDYQNYDAQLKLLQDEIIKKDLLLKQRSDEADSLRYKITTIESQYNKYTIYEDENRRL